MRRKSKDVIYLDLEEGKFDFDYTSDEKFHFDGKDKNT